MINEKIAVSPLISGLLMTLLFAFFGTLIMLFMRRYEDFTPPKDFDEDKWKRAFRISSRQRIPTILIGFFEAILCFFAFYISKPELIFAWLTFKVASKWETWNTIMKIPEKIEGIDTIEYIGAKNRFASNTLQRWLTGTLLNVLAGFLGWKTWIICNKTLNYLCYGICK